jgi:hypothetical protein
MLLQKAGDGMHLVIAQSQGGVQVPLEWVAVVVTSMAVAITVLFKWALRLLHKSENLQRQLLEEKEQKVAILTELKRLVEEKRRRKDSQRGEAHNG